MIPQIFSRIQKLFCRIKIRGFWLEVAVIPKLFKMEYLKILYYILNHYENDYFISISGLPYCLLPDATEHIDYKKDYCDYLKDDVCKNCSYLRRCQGWPEELKIKRSKMSFIKDIPKEIVIEVTNQCNSACKTCVMDKKSSLYVSFKTVKRIIDECSSIGINAIRFTGGEPFLNPEINKMLVYARRKKFYVLLNTNASLIDDSTIELLSETTDNILVSLQGFDQITEGILTGANVDFLKKLTTISRLNTRLPALRIGTVISKTFILNMSKYARIIGSLGIKNWELYRSLVEHKTEFDIVKPELLKIMRYLYTLRKKHINAKIANPVPFCISLSPVLSLATLLGGVADDGHSRIVWDPEGFFKPSYFIQKNIGNTITDAWNHPFIKNIRSLDYLPFLCQKCRYLLWCKGGSRVMANIASHSYFGDDPLFMSCQ